MKLFQAPTLIAFIAIILISSPTLLDLTKPGIYTSHDGETHTARIAQYYQALIDGQVPPRFAGSFYNGFGSPIFIYIYPMPYLLGAIIHLIGFSFSDSFKILMGAGFIFSGLFTYLWLSNIFKYKQAAFIGAIFYAWSPYRLQLIYVRGSISELLAYTFLPLALLTITKLKETNSSKWLSFSAIAISLVFLSQNLVALLSIPLIFFYAILISYNDKLYRLLLKTAISLLWALAISSFTYFPALFERQFIKFNEAFQLVYNSHFVTVKQLIRSPWGYGFDLPGTINDEMSFQIGLAHILLLVVSLIVVIFKLLKSHKKYFKENSQIGNNYLVAILLFLALALSLFLTIENPLTKFIWTYFPPLHIIDIPWRLLGISTILIAMIAAFLTYSVRSGLLFILLIIAVLVANRNHVRINKSLDYNDEFFLNYSGTATQLNEFTPRSRSTYKVPEFSDKNLIVNTVSGWAKYEDLESNSKKISSSITVLSENAQIRINKFYFPVTRITVDGKKLNENNDYFSHAAPNVRLDSKEETQGAIFVNLKKGKHNLEMSYTETNLRKFANLLTLFSLALAVSVFFLPKNFISLKHFKK